MSKIKVGSPEFIAEAKSLGLDPYEYFYFRKNKDKMEMTNRIMAKYVSIYIIPMLNEWKGLFDYFAQKEKRRLRNVNKLLKEFCNDMGYMVEDYPDHYANLRGYESWQQFRYRHNKGICKSLKKKYCEAKDPNSLFLSLDTIREVTGCRIPIKREERIKKEQWLREELKKTEDQRKMEMEKEIEEEILRKIEIEEQIRTRLAILERDKMSVQESVTIVPKTKYEIRIIGGKPHKCKIECGKIVKDCGQYDIRQRKVIGPPLLTNL